MLYRRFGRTNLQMPVFSCGGMRYQYKWQDVPLAEVPPDNQANLEATIRRSVEVGINHIETARGYGSSERQLGLILPKFPREKLIVQTKIGPESDPAKFVRNFEESLERLQLSQVDLLAIHGINNMECLDAAVGSDGKSGCLAEARKLQARGLARHIGFSTHAPLHVILAALKHDFDYVNLHWYYIFQRNWPAVEEATRRDMGVFIISPSDKGGMLYNPPARLVELCRPMSPIAMNNIYCLSRPEVHTLSVGAARPGDFDEHVDSLKWLPEALKVLPPVVARLSKAFHDAVPAGLRDPWALGFPEPEEAPGGLNLPVILWLRNLVKAFDLLEYGQMRYNLFGNGGHWFPGKPIESLDTLDLATIARTSGLGGDLKGLLAETRDLLRKESVKRLSQS